MLDFQHYDLGQQPAGAVVKVTLDARVNVRLMDQSNFQSYRNGGQHNCIGGEAVKSPVTLQIPHAGHWHVALDLGGGAGEWRSSVTVS